MRSSIMFVVSCSTAISVLFSGQALAARWQPLQSDGQTVVDPEGDLHCVPDTRETELPWDIVGDDNRPAAYWAVDLESLHLRMRLDDDPSGTFSGGAYGFLLDTDLWGDSFEYMVATEDAGEEVCVYENTSAEPEWYAQADQVLFCLGSDAVTVTVAQGRSFGDYQDYYLDITLPLADLREAGIIDDAISSMQVAAGTDACSPSGGALLASDTSNLDNVGSQFYRQLCQALTDPIEMKFDQDLLLSGIQDDSADSILYGAASSAEQYPEAADLAGGKGDSADSALCDSSLITNQYQDGAQLPGGEDDCDGCQVVDSSWLNPSLTLYAEDAETADDASTDTRFAGSSLAAGRFPHGAD